MSTATVLVDLLTISMTSQRQHHISTTSLSGEALDEICFLAKYLNGLTYEVSNWVYHIHIYCIV